ncbi:CCA tRNA nucleotidyltransferase 1, mitochondrial [Phymastichus coffea]|uniref:CCA tRNA nucleotidyltransferase 1, mitochondrial n=1 Tax=Phymastichus coffea TaxID=108790 RepID=UPI00273C5936|nr:CCA tRNA nucleotidyltransferase 1, mitochondrial [Phymastichus coffea]
MIINKLIKQFTLFYQQDYFYIVKRLTATNKWLKYKMVNDDLPPYRKDPVIKILDTPEFKSIFTPELRALDAVFKKYNYQIRVAGGAVRDILMGMHPSDLDFATTATPTQMKEMFLKEEIRMINTNGEKHGTITGRINDKENFEVTTLRIDVVTDGRHAEVEFTTDWLLDAGRRDLTINSMFLDLDGRIYDYFYGYDDLMKKRVAFVGDPAQRITEDFLRIFRYFRFYGRIAEVPDNHDEKTINAIKEYANGLERISGERIWNEWSKILEGKFHKELTEKIVDCGCSKYIGLPKNPNLKQFEEVCLRAQKNNIKLKPVTLVTALLNDQEEVLEVFKRLKFSAYDRDLAFFLVHHRNDKPCEKPLQPYQKIVLKTIGKVSDIREYVAEVLKYRGSLELLKEFEEWDSRFPVNGNMIKPYADKNHKVIGEVLSKLKDIWLDSDCQLPVEKLQTYIPNLAAQAVAEFNEKLELRDKMRKERKKSVSR